jgi:hypothetical protein
LRKVTQFRQLPRSNYFDRLYGAIAPKLLPLVGSLLQFHDDAHRELHATQQFTVALRSWA